MRDINNLEADEFEERIKNLHKKLSNAREEKDLETIKEVISDINQMIGELDLGNKNE